MRIVGKTIRVNLKRGLRRLLRLRGSPRQIALGVGIGMFVAFTPTLGMQMVIAAFLATLLGGNRAAAVAMVWLTNPVTVVPVFGGTYWLGTIFYSGPPTEHVTNIMKEAMADLANYEIWRFYDQFLAFLAIGRNIMIPMTIGGVIAGTVLGVASYFAALQVIDRFKHLREKLHHHA